MKKYFGTIMVWVSMFAVLCVQNAAAQVSYKTCQLLPTMSSPTASPDEGNYATPQSVTLSSPDGGVVCYTTNGTNPAASTPGTCSAGSTYSSPISITSLTTIKFLATRPGYNNSAIVTKQYDINPFTVLEGDHRGGGSNSYFTFNTTSTAAGTLFLLFTYSDASTTSMTYDGSGCNISSWTDSGVDSNHLRVAYGFNTSTAGAFCQVTVTCNGASECHGTMTRVTGVNATTPVLQVVQNKSGSTTPASMGSLSSTAGSLWFSYYESGVSINHDSAWTTAGAWTDGSSTMLQYRRITGTSVTPSVDLSFNFGWIGIAVELQAQ